MLPGALLKNATLRFLSMDCHMRVERTDTPYTRHFQRGAVFGQVDVQKPVVKLPRGDRGQHRPAGNGAVIGQKHARHLAILGGDFRHIRAGSDLTALFRDQPGKGLRRAIAVAALCYDSIDLW